MKENKAHKSRPEAQLGAKSDSYQDCAWRVFHATLKTVKFII